MRWGGAILCIFLWSFAVSSIAQPSVLIESRCADWSGFNLPVTAEGEARVYELFKEFVSEYQSSRPDDGCLMGMAMAMTQRLFANPQAEFYEQFLHFVEDTYHEAAKHSKTVAMEAIVELATIFQGRWCFLYIDSYSRAPNNRDIYLLGGAAGTVALIMAVGYISRFKIVGQLSFNILKKFAGLWRHMATLPTLMGLTGGAAGLASSRKNHKTKGANPLSAIDAPEEFARAPFEIITMTEGLKSSYNRAETLRSLQAVLGGAAASYLVAISPRTALWIYRSYQIYVNGVAAGLAEKASILRLAAILGESRAAAFVTKPGLITGVAAFAISYVVNKFVDGWAHDQYVRQFQKAFDGTRDQLRAMKGGGSDWDRFYLGEKLVIAEREWSAMEAAPAVHDLNQELVDFHFSSICMRLSTRAKGTADSPVWPRRHLGLESNEYNAMFEMRIQKFRDSLFRIQKRHEPILLLSRKGFNSTKKALDENNVPFARILKDELEPGIRTTENLLAMSQFADVLIQEVRDIVAPLDDPKVWLDYEVLRQLAERFGCYVQSAPIEKAQ